MAAKKLGPSLTAAARAAFTAIKADAPKDRFYFYALYTTVNGSYVGATAWSEEALARVVKASASSGKRTPEELARALRFSAPDSPFHDTHDEPFAGLAPGKKLHDACFDTMRELDFEGFFGSGAPRSKVLINVVYGDMSDERWLEHANRLNSRAAIARVMPYLRLHRPTGKVEAWGAKAYQVNALSLSADRSRVAYSGSGGEVGILETATRIPIYEGKRAGEHWACALDPDGARLFLGDRDAIVVLDPRSPNTPPVRFARMGKPSALAITDAHLAASSWSAALRVFDKADGKKLWEDGSFRRAAIAFSPDGAWLAAADDSKVACFESATGALRWSGAHEGTDRHGLAWASDERLVAGGDLLAATTGKRLRALSWSGPIGAVAVSPGGDRLALTSKEVLVVLDEDGRELARGTGTQEQLIACAFLDDATAVAAGRDVNRGPALVTLRV